MGQSGGSIVKAKKGTELMQEAFVKSIKEVTEILDRKRAVTDVGKFALVTMSNYTRMKSAEVHEDSVRLMAARMREIVVAESKGVTG